MPAKSLDEAIKRGMCTGPLNQIHIQIKNELRDYLAHETMYEISKYIEGTKENPQSILLNFFTRLFKD